jgi:hypothetical protein
MNGEDSTIRIHAEGVPGIRCPFSFFDGLGALGCFAGIPSVANFMPVPIGIGLRIGWRGKRKGQLWKQPTVNDCLPYEKEVVVGVFVFGIRAKTLSLVDDVKLLMDRSARKTALSPRYDLKDPFDNLKPFPDAAFNIKKH